LYTDTAVDLWVESAKIVLKREGQSEIMITYDVIQNPSRILETAIVRITGLCDEYWRIVVFFLDPTQCLPETPGSNLKIMHIH
jgi:hypothetical protein